MSPPWTEQIWLLIYIYIRIYVLNHIRNCLFNCMFVSLFSHHYLPAERLPDSMNLLSPLPKSSVLYSFQEFWTINRKNDYVNNPTTTLFCFGFFRTQDFLTLILLKLKTKKSKQDFTCHASLEGCKILSLGPQSTCWQSREVYHSE